MFKELITKISDILNRNNIPYMLIGGQAVLLYGEPRLTKDIDITLGFSHEKLSEFQNIINNIPLKALPGDIKTFVTKTMVLPTIHEETGIRVDFIFSFSLYEQEAIKRVNKVMLNKTQVNFASVEDVIIHKIIAHRERDIEDARIIIIKNPDIDKQYITKWLSEFNEVLPEIGILQIFNDLIASIENK